MSDDVLHSRPTVAGVSANQIAEAIGGELIGDGDTQVVGIGVDSTDVRPGEAFIAVPGFTTHGARFADAAIASGAILIITDKAGREHLTSQPAALIEVTDPRAIVGTAAALVFGYPARDLELCAVTGTNGKTSTATILHQILRNARGEAGIFGTVEVRIGEDAAYSPRTTLEASLVNRLMSLARERDVTTLVLEASSQALHLGRLNDLQFDIAGFVNLQHDHLDYHHTMAEYFEAKAMLFEPNMCRSAVICIDDEWGAKLAARVAVPHLTVSTGADADLIARDVGPTAAGMRFTVLASDGEHPIEMPLTSRVMVQNAMVAIGMARRAGVSWETITDAMRVANPAPGRMEVVQARNETHPLVIVDYAHTPDALEALMPELRALTPGNLIIVFGSDGDRDQAKRPLLGKIAADQADLLYVTDESPRTEDPAAIRAQILAGVREVRPDLAGVIEDTESRTHALTAAILAAHPADTVVVTGKGAEQYQVVGTENRPYNDVPVARAAIEQRQQA
ncbi:UDP-N-acetylmuramoyl-L-alanyl-D-glutamate--2,6-diaminopimelate ligase [Bowdeniella nasicola]|uniref:UDP-N-acetylmuramoyl-L-alanyl-D-glutamate--2, 6-diaminopimelate ligase n=1 Tax=Bowdeniella nasicola TaxID=208480 RepID=UPI0009FAE02A|nr:UDP-N-acetylmuramoyl-L-alanyl-D-glutamate--2,6-diaminopimelate ligase [Bowdeniella nasicola]